MGLFLESHFFVTFTQFSIIFLSISIKFIDF